MEKILAKTSTAAGEMFYSFRDMTVALQEVGLDFCKLATFEEKSGDQQHSFNCKVNSVVPWLSVVLVDSLLDREKILAFLRNQVMGQSCVRTSRTMGKGHGRTIRSLEVLHDYLAFTPAIKLACQDRTSVVLIYESIERDILKKKEQIKRLEEREKTRGSDPMTVKKREESNHELRTLEKLKAYAAEQVSKVKRIVKEEFVRYDEEKKQDFRTMLKNYAVSQVCG